jgi:hypothetical protein
MADVYLRGTLGLSISPKGLSDEPNFHGVLVIGG